MKSKTPGQILESLREHAPSQKRLQAAIGAAMRSYFKNGGYIDPKAKSRLGATLAASNAMADLVGRAGMRLDRKGPAPVHFAADFSFTLGAGIRDITHTDAYKDLIDREPALGLSALEIEEAYSSGEYIFALADQTSDTITRNIQEVIRKAMRVGQDVSTASKQIAAMGDYPQRYVATVFRTNTTTAYGAGRMREAQRMSDEGLLVALKYSATLDGNVRPNHRAAHGLIAAPNDPVWNYLTPSLGFQCRCSLIPMDEIDIPKHLIRDGEVRKAKVPPGAHPDSPGFGRRTDREMYS